MRAISPYSVGRFGTPYYDDANVEGCGTPEEIPVRSASCPPSACVSDEPRGDDCPGYAAAPPPQIHERHNGVQNIPTTPPHIYAGVVPPVGPDHFSMLTPPPPPPPPPPEYHQYPFPPWEGYHRFMLPPEMIPPYHMMPVYEGMQGGVPQGYEERNEEEEEARREWVARANLVWNTLLSETVLEGAERLRIVGDYHAGVDDLLELFLEIKKRWVDFELSQRVGRNAILLEYQQGVLDVGFVFQSGCADPKNVYRRTRSDLTEERRRCKEEIREAQAERSALYSNKMVSLLAEEEAHARLAILYAQTEAGGEIAAELLSGAARTAGKSHAQQLKLRSQMSATEQMHQQALSIARSVEEKEKSRAIAEKETLKAKRDLEGRLADANRTVKDLRESASEKNRDLKVKYAETLSKKMQEHSAQHERQREKLITEISSSRDTLLTEKKRTEVSSRLIKELQTQNKSLEVEVSRVAVLEGELEGLRREKLQVESKENDQDQLQGELSDAQQIIESLEQDLQAERRKNEYDHAELQKLRLQQRRSETLEEQVSQSSTQLRKVQRGLDEARKEKDAQYAELKQARYTVAHAFDIINESFSESVQLLGDLEYTSRTSLKKEALSAFGDLQLMQQIARRGVM